MAVQPAAQEAESDSHEGMVVGSANLLAGLAVLFVMLIVALATAFSSTGWMWLVGYELLMVGYPMRVEAS